MRDVFRRKWELVRGNAMRRIWQKVRAAVDSARVATRAARYPQLRTPSESWQMAGLEPADVQLANKLTTWSRATASSYGPSRLSGPASKDITHLFHARHSGLLAERALSPSHVRPRFRIGSALRRAFPYTVVPQRVTIPAASAAEMLTHARSHPAFVLQVARLTYHLDVVFGVCAAFVFRHDAMHVQTTTNLRFVTRAELATPFSFIPHAFLERAQTVLSFVFALRLTLPSVFASKLVRTLFRAALIPTSGYAAFKRKKSVAAVPANSGNLRSASSLHVLSLSELSIHAASAVLIISLFAVPASAQPEPASSLGTFPLPVTLPSMFPVPAETPDPSDGWMRAGLVSLAAVSFSDLETTGRCLERPTCRERNPLLKPFSGSPGAVGLVSGALSGGVGLGAYRLHKSGKRKQARMLVWGWTAVRGLVVLHNVRELRK